MDVETLIGKYVLSGRQYEPAEVLASLLPIADVTHDQAPWIWKTIADAADRQGADDIFLEFSERFIFSPDTQRGDYRIGKIWMITNRIRLLLSRGETCDAELAEFNSLSPSEHNWEDLSAAGVKVRPPDLATFDADETLVVQFAKEEELPSVSALNGEHFASITKPGVRPSIRFVEDVQYFVLGSDTSVVKADGRFYRYMSRSKAAQNAWLDKVAQSSPRPLRGTVVALNDHFTQSNYCHWMLDWYPRLLLAQRYGGKVDFVLTRHARSRFELETLQLAGLEEHQVLIDTDNCWYTVDRLITVDNDKVSDTHPAWHANPSILKLVRSKIVGDSNFDLPTPKRIYVSRRDVGSRVVINQDEVDSIISDFGFVCVDLAGRSVREQAHLFSRCEMLLGVHGAGLTNMLFMPAGGTVIELLHYKYGSPSYSYLARGCSHHYAHLSCDNIAFSDKPILEPSLHNQVKYLSENIWVDVRVLRSALSAMIRNDNSKHV